MQGESPIDFHSRLPKLLEQVQPALAEYYLRERKDSLESLSVLRLVQRPYSAVVFLQASTTGERERLVMKPNDEYGGTGVFIGWEMTDVEWEQALGRALESSYVVQERVVLERQSFLELGGDGVARDFIVDLDPFVFGGEIEGFLTRLSSTSLANVTSGAGAIPSFLVEPR